MPTPPTTRLAFEREEEEEIKCQHLVVWSKWSEWNTIPLKIQDLDWLFPFSKKKKPRVHSFVYLYSAVQFFSSEFIPEHTLDCGFSRSPQFGLCYQDTFSWTAEMGGFEIKRKIKQIYEAWDLDRRKFNSMGLMVKDSDKHPSNQTWFEASSWTWLAI